MPFLIMLAAALFIVSVLLMGFVTPIPAIVLLGLLVGVALLYVKQREQTK